MAVVAPSWSKGAEMSASGASHCVSSASPLRPVGRGEIGRSGCLRANGAACASRRSLTTAYFAFRSRKTFVAVNAALRQDAARLMKGSVAARRMNNVQDVTIASIIKQETLEVVETGKEQGVSSSSSLTPLEESVASSSDGPWPLSEVESIIRGQLGRYALIGALLLGVGWLATTTAEAEAATTSTSQMLKHGEGGWDAVDMRALALGPEGPLVEEFWENVRRYGLYFVTVVSGGVYALVKPIIEALRSPLSAVLVIIIVIGSLFLLGLTISAMLGINEYQYDYAP